MAARDKQKLHNNQQASRLGYMGIHNEKCVSF